MAPTPTPTPTPPRLNPHTHIYTHAEDEKKGLNGLRFGQAENGDLGASAETGLERVAKASLDIHLSL